MTRTDWSFSLPASLDQMARLGDLVRRWAVGCAGVDEDLASRLELATHEVATNIIRHAYDPATSGAIDVELCGSAGELVVILRDHGQPFDPTVVTPPEPGNPRIGGYGLYLAERLVDEVQYQRITTTNQWRLTCRQSPSVQQES